MSKVVKTKKMKLDTRDETFEAFISLQVAFTIISKVKYEKFCLPDVEAETSASADFDEYSFKRGKKYHLEIRLMEGELDEK